MKIVAIVQARMNSTRFPNKVMKTINGIPMIEILLKRLSKSKKIDKIILATSTDDKDQNLFKHVKGLGITCAQGSENDVLDRYFNAAKESQADIILRITGDCPLIDPDLVDESIDEFKKINVDYLSNINPPTYPDGLDIEVMKFSALEKAANEATKLADREHVTSYILNSDNFVKSNLTNKHNLSDLRWTVDEKEDLDVISKVFEHFKPNIYFNWKEVLDFQKKNPKIFSANIGLTRNEGTKMNTGQKFWKRAKKIIPGGNMLLSKRAEMFLPDQWPAYFSKAKGCKIWDLDNNEYVDMSIMGIGTNILGYGHPEVDEVVRKTVENGNMSTFNCPEEVLLAEKLIEIHPWSNMVKFARSGGEANAIAIRIARAAAGRDKVAICGYHGWHDWYLSANLNNDKSLDGHLLPGLEPKGVPRNLKETVFPFNYNNFEELLELVNNHDIGVIKMEVIRNKGQENDFLNKVRQLADDRKIVLIFDECTSGFRETLGGIHKKYNVEPDIAIFGKAMGNGYAITAIIGRDEIMQASQSTFISSTFWTERIGPAAALKTLEIMEREKTWETITNTGREIKKIWQNLADHHNLKISHWGLDALAGFTFKSKDALAYKTLITQEMLSKGYLAGDCIYVCIEHNPEIIKGYSQELDKVFGLIKECENGLDIKKLLKGDVCHSGFKRLA